MRLVESVRQDVASAGRVLAKSPGFTAAVALSLALGIGANTAIFTLIDAVMWRMLPVKDPDTLLLAVEQEGDAVRSGFTYNVFRSMRDTSVAADVAGYAGAPINVTVDGPPEPAVLGHLVTGNYFALLGVDAALGRALGADDDRVPGGHPVAMLGYGYWDRRFARDPLVLGRTIRVSGMPFTIVGIAPRGFTGVEVGSAPDLFLPIMMQPTIMPAFENLLDGPINQRTWVHTIARVRPGATRGQAAAALEALVRSDENRRTTSAKPPVPAPRIVLAPVTDVSALRRQFSRPLFVLFAMVGVVLLIACANTANLLLARAARRRPEFATRLALGAGRGRLMRQLLAESVALAALGGACGVLLAQWATRLLVLYISIGRAPIALDLTPNARILAFTAAISVLTGVLFGLAPAWRATRLEMAPALRNSRTLSTYSLRTDRALSVAQLALSLVLLAGAALFLRTLQNLQGTDAGVPRQSVVVMRVEPRGSDQRGIPGTSERLDRIYRELIRRARDIPQVILASMAQSTPTAPSSSASAFIPTRSGEQVRVPVVMVYPGYFATIGIPIVRGRDFTANDLGERAPRVCIVNESFIRQYVPAEDPIGKPCMKVSHGPRTEPHLIVGVAGDSRYHNPEGRAQPFIYSTFLHTNTGRGQMVLHVRVAGAPAGIVQRIREEVAAVDPTMPVFDVHTLEEEMDAALVQQRLIAMLAGLFGGLALLLACVGLYGLLAFATVQRRNEMGIRLALGAQRGQVVWLVVRDAMSMVALGLALGVTAAVGVARVAASQLDGLLFGLSATDPITIGAATLMLALVAAAAAYVPAYRASRVDPMLALRTE